MAMQAGMSFQKILMLAGLGYTGTILVKDGKLPELLRELQSLVERLSKSGEQDNFTDAIKDQLNRLKFECQRASSGQIFVRNENSGGNATSLMIPAATLGALGYGYMWWKGLSFADLMYVTRKSMATAVSNLNKHLESVTEALTVAKKHLTQRIQNLNDKVEKQNEISKDIRKNVEEACDDLFKVEHNLKDLQSMIYCLDGKIDSLADKQDITNIGMYLLCNFVDGKKGRTTESMQEQLKLGEKARRLLKAPSPMGLKEITDSLSGTISQPVTDTIKPDSINNLDDQQRLLLRASSAWY
ncbi:DUF1664 domain-containing protein [Citrus sinensis]|uniref:DUF1664 domain-containing protein n=2 Tax=Citrus sinensis TaxID=2711 RepID=A0ACB8LJW4_CITSI|nr:DUF1664 domain-containing protein [Citrus sinensis]KDO82810.1 hypothetical protein CISIN_1g022352mg [Citrus sinensis]